MVHIAATPAPFDAALKTTVLVCLLITCTVLTPSAVIRLVEGCRIGDFGAFAMLRQRSEDTYTMLVGVAQRVNRRSRGMRSA